MTQYEIGEIDLTAQVTAAKTATDYMAFDSNTGLKIASLNPLTATRRVQIASDKISIYNDNSNYTYIDSNGLTIYKGGNNIASFGDTIRIGKSGGSHIELDYHSLKLIDKEGESYFHVSDLRDSTGYATLTETIITTSQQSSVTVQCKIASIISAVDSSNSSNTVDHFSYDDVYFQDPIPADTSVTITYTTSNSLAKAFSFGSRKNNSTIGLLSFSEGGNIIAAGSYSHAEGNNTTTMGDSSHAEGYNTRANGWSSHAEGWNATASGSSSHAEGENTIANGQASHVEGVYSTANGKFSHAEGFYTKANGERSHAEGSYTTANAYASHAEGSGHANGSHSHAEGESTKANGRSSHAEGHYTWAEGDYSHAEGYNVGAEGSYSHAEGRYTGATGTDSHAEGYNTRANGWASHAEGCDTKANGENSHAEGYNTIANGKYSHASGYCTIANNLYQSVCGKWNRQTSALFVVGSGDSDTSRKNALTIFGSSAYFNGTTSANGTAITSDIRVKENIKLLNKDESIQFINQLKPSSYIKNGDKKELGFIAQDIEKIKDYKDYLVTIDNSGEYDLKDYRLLNYQGLIAPTVAALQGALEKIEILENKIEILENKIKILILKEK